MKNKILATIVVVILVVSCNQKNKETDTNHHMMGNDSTMMQNDSTMMKNDSTMMGNGAKMMDKDKRLYACPMHPEVQGKLNDKCSKCGMKLTVPVPE
jgi:hypothetical protein